MKFFLITSVLTFIFVFFLQQTFAQEGDSTLSVTWNINNVESIEGHPTSKLGDPQVQDVSDVTAVWFDGIDDGLIVDSNPLEGTTSFTVEVLFKPDSSFPNNEAQRFIHIQNPNDDNRRILIELRLTDDHHWYLDTFIKSELSSLALMDEKQRYPVNEWYHAAMVYDNGVMTSYVDGIEQLSGEVDFLPISGGKTSIGTRMNLRSWFKGSIRTLKVTHRALVPEEFMISPSSVGEANVIIPGSELMQNYPNPFNPSTAIKFEAPESSHVKLGIFNIRGQEVIILADNHYRTGIHEIQWNGRNKHNLQVVSGMYFYRISSDKCVLSRKMLLLR